MNPRGVTLVELLAAISILVVVTALALPALQNRMSAARVEAAKGEVQAAVLAARTEAMRRGKSLSLDAVATRAGEVELLIAPIEGSETPATGARSDGERAPSRGSKWGSLPAGVKVDQKAASQLGTIENLNRETAAEPGEVRLAVFCPDGTAIASPAYLSDGDAVLKISVNPWIGLVEFSPYVGSEGDSNEAKPGDEIFPVAGEAGAAPKPPATPAPAVLPAKGKSP